MVRRACLSARPGAVAGRAASRELPAIPAAPEARLLFGRTGHEKAQEPAVQQLTSCVGIEHETDRAFLRYQSSRSALDVGASAGVIRSAPFRLRGGTNAGRVAAVMERRAGEAGD